MYVYFKVLSSLFCEYSQIARLLVDEMILTLMCLGFPSAAFFPLLCVSDSSGGCHPSSKFDAVGRQGDHGGREKTWKV